MGSPEIDFEKKMREWDLVVVGGSLSGLFVAQKFKSEKEGSRVVVLEKGPELGGRIRTCYDGTTVLYEAGAWRIDDSHAEVRRLVDELNENERADQITLSPHPSETNRCNRRYPHAAHVPPLAEETQQDISTWAAHAFVRSPAHAGHTLSSGGYGTKTTQARGSQSYESKPDATFSRVDQGISSIVAKLERCVRKLGVHIYTNCRVTDVRYIGETYCVSTLTRKKGDGAPDSFRTEELRGRKCCLALPPEFWTKFAIYDHLRMTAAQVGSYALVHVYAEVDQDLLDEMGSTSTRGFHFLHKGVGSQIISPSHGNNIMQLAYAGAENAMALRELWEADPKELKRQLVADLWSTFELKGAADADRVGQLRVHYWHRANHYWKAALGLDTKAAMHAATVAPHPSKLPHLVTCGEAFSTQQGWMEGALQTGMLAVSELLQERAYLHRLPALNLNYELRFDYDDWILDAERWKHVHPGGELALAKHNGRDITLLFDSVHNTKHALRVAANMRVGVRHTDGTIRALPGANGAALSSVYSRSRRQRRL